MTNRQAAREAETNAASSGMNDEQVSSDRRGEMFYEKEEGEVVSRDGAGDEVGIVWALCQCV